MQLVLQQMFLVLLSTSDKCYDDEENDHNGEMFGVMAGHRKIDGVISSKIHCQDLSPPKTPTRSWLEPGFMKWMRSPSSQIYVQNYQ